MSITFGERPGGYSATHTRVARTWWFAGSDDEDEIATAAESVLPATVGSFTRRTIRVELIATDEWDVEGEWTRPEDAPPTPTEEGEVSQTFSTLGGTQRITQSRSVVGAWVTGGAVSVPDGAIGVTDDGVEGTEIVSPRYVFAEEWTLPAEFVTETYRGNLFLLTGRYNSAPFRGLQIGECLFLGAEGAKRRSDGLWVINYQFAGAPNVTNLTIGTIEPFSKLGWDHLDIQYEEIVGATGLRRRPALAIVHRVHLPGDFDLLALPTP